MNKSVVRIGWEHENFLTPMVLLSKKHRDELGVNLKDIVKVTKGDRTAPAVVQCQFRNLLDSGVTVNHALKNILDINQEDSILIEK